MSTNTYNTNNDPLGNFIVIQDGELDLSYAEAHDKAARNALLHEYARQTGLVAINALRASVKGIGRATLEILDAAAQAGREAA
jgi:hypothetical protein